MQHCGISIANALEIMQGCTKPSKYAHDFFCYTTSIHFMFVPIFVYNPLLELWHDCRITSEVTMKEMGKIDL